MVVMNSVAAVVVTYNRRQLLLNNVQCLLSQTRPADIIIIDNASTDGTAEALRPFVDEGKITYINTGANLGGAGGFQYGIKHAVGLGYKYVWLMDDDCMPCGTALEELMAADGRLGANYGFLCSKVLWKDGEVCAMNVPRRTLTKPLKSYSGGDIPVAMASFVSLFLRAEVVREVGLPIKEFFIWTDDWEYTRRISLKFPCYCVCPSVVVHHSASNIGANIATESADRIQRFFYLYRNDVYLYRREGLKGFLYECVRLTSHFFRVLFRARDNKFKRIKMMVRGTRAGLSFRPPVEYI